MKIGFLSDTHGNASSFEKAMQLMHDADIIIHCGDVLPKYYGRLENDKEVQELAARIKKMDNIYLVKGNGDEKEHEEWLGHKFHSPALKLQFGDYRIFASHGHYYSRMALLLKAQEEDCNIVCYGHTHVKELDSDDKILVLNPGSVALPRDGSPSCAILENNIMSIFHLDTGELIAQLPIPI
ncbi:MAG: phosphodiesterase [Peptostreptococcaceae bacterium]|nr:phosphodiesterase [Peptostreptococcaceae bacterium]